MALSLKNKRNLLVALWIAILVATDLSLKQRIFNQSLNTQFITPVINNAAAWSIWLEIPIIIGISFLACIGMFYLHYKRYITNAAFVFLLAGALGNMYDRIVYDGVRDRIHIGNFPVFNIADICLTIGVIMLAFHYKKQSRQHKAL